MFLTFLPRRSYVCLFSTLLLPTLLLPVLLLAPSAASAHVKWFVENANVALSPEGPGTVLTPLFLAVCATFTVLVFAGFLLDGVFARRWPWLVSMGSRHVAKEEALVRIAVGAYFLLLWDRGAVATWETGRVLLTPELAVHMHWLALLQFVIAFFVIWRSTCIFSAAALCILYIDGIRMFGPFHMTDYVFFPGIAAYLALTTIGTPRALSFRVPVLSGGLAFGLMWTAVEKFVYPQWTAEIIARHAELSFGFPPGFAIVVAGFVEFTLAYFMMTGQGLVRFGAAGYALIFLAAIPTFGHLDAVGHIPIVGILLVVCIHGASPLQRMLGILERGRVANAAAISGLYLATLLAFFGMYYGMHNAEFGTAATSATAALPQPEIGGKLCQKGAGTLRVSR